MPFSLHIMHQGLPAGDLHCLNPLGGLLWPGPAIALSWSGLLCPRQHDALTIEVIYNLLVGEDDRQLQIVYEMGRNSQTLSFLNNLNLLLFGPDTTLEGEKDGTVVKQFLPRKQDAEFGDQFIFQTTSLQQRINAKLMLLAPVPCGASPLAKSVIYLSSLTGPIRATVLRRPDVENHSFCLYVLARESDVEVTLPPLFRGVVHVNGIYRKKRTRYCQAFRSGVLCGDIRMDGGVAVEGDDEVYIHTEGRIRLRLSGNDGRKWQRVGRHVRRIFGGR